MSKRRRTKHPAKGREHGGVRRRWAVPTVLALVAVATSWTVLWARADSPFDGRRAYADLEKLVALGPRVAGSPAGAQARAYIKEQLTRAGLKVREQAFDADTPLGKRKMVNVTGVVKGTRPGIIILGNHYDTKYFPQFRFVGANDGGSTTAWLIEMARTLGPHREGLSVWLCFFDGEEAFEKWTELDSLYGSRAFVKHLEATGGIGQVKAMINVDMIGDCSLAIHRDGEAPGWLEEAVWSQAKRLGHAEHFLETPRLVADDHIPFRRAGVPALNLIDFEYGRSPEEHRATWHTPNDTIDRVCADSLQAVGDVIYHALPVVEAHADQ